MFHGVLPGKKVANCRISDFFRKNHQFCAALHFQTNCRIRAGLITQTGLHNSDRIAGFRQDFIIQTCSVILDKTVEETRANVKKRKKAQGSSCAFN